MSVASLDHVNIRTTDVPTTIEFFRDVLGMETAAPPGSSGQLKNWVLDAAGRPIVHIGGVDGRYPGDDVRPFSPQKGSGSVHHVALRCTDYSGMHARLKARDLLMTENHIPQMRLRQLFVNDPNGVLLELNFFDS